MALVLVLGCLLMWSGAAFGQAGGQPAPSPAAPPALAPPAMPAPPEPPPAVQPALQTTPMSAPPAAGPKAAGPHRFYNLSTVETLAGSVASVQRGPMRKGGKGNIVRFNLKTDKGQVLVVLGPAKYVDTQPLKLAAGDQVEVKGSRITGPKGRTSVTAAEVTKGGQVMKLRDDQGNPLWPKGQGKKRRAR
jgi:hypothetical protein